MTTSDSAQLYRKKFAALFPTGTALYQPSNGRPVRGARSDETGRALYRGDIIIGLDGKTVQNANQLRYLRRAYTLRTGEAENIPMIVCRQGNYVEVKDTTSNVSVSDYNGGQPPSINTSPAPSFVSAAPQIQTAKDTLPTQLRLNGLSGVAPHRLAIINGKTVAPGESAVIKLADQTVTLRCVSVGDKSATVAIDGVNGTKELNLSP